MLSTSNSESKKEEEVSENMVEQNIKGVSNSQYELATIMH
jgi:hypothetical protein